MIGGKTINKTWKAATKTAIICLDVMTAELGLAEAVEGARLAGKKYDCSIILAGKEDMIKPCLISEDEFQIVHAENEISNEDSLRTIVKDDCSSINNGLEQLINGVAHAFVSPGNTGAVVMKAMEKFRIGDYRRYPIMAALPTLKANHLLYLLDTGATTDCSAYDLLRFAVMADAYLRDVKGIERPRIALLSNGTEKTKGNKAAKEAYRLISDYPAINFAGYAEPKNMLCRNDTIDAVVADGYIGNILLKTGEAYVHEFVSEVVKKNFLSPLRLFSFIPAMLSIAPMAGVYSAIKAIKHEMSPSAYGGAILLGMKKPVVITHGSADRHAICSAVGTAVTYAQNMPSDSMFSALQNYDRFLKEKLK